ncbi:MULTISPECIES: c-type cytochrome biogenesis protein CcmI [Aliivibrio]|uniref:C-type cytochrome biogenesis protein CcmI n=1 Tax=Aliivibrio finisterrensis TaxID=511998 RepID=A0A4Q5KRW7_9GAMM|nr:MULTISPECIES: c-type cytochrome biogenesis protein CcmI [Aliivibrio]MDD9179397.1 c-type cytochrome biogenesis protein CcmI [Aliivibrio sp. A6]RYU49962.1 c-type cytochrome biogenesis protein CcmI [Aliivibrio finisterrensis]RYU50609.1 c-type cytochrome biogenesis protein CcmI [Aliivibrio finisterrensis]RYU56670.1 c-type cytochrome biogenesis protein CcmI [Aliivibrio finisterrensis]RYU62691.1 c-type cytochrome biogenesis protein CcmI [Aliivibrio finisterrensis]
MILFWISTLALIVVGVVFIALPLWKAKAQDDEARRDELNKAFYKDRLAELKEEDAEGLVNNQDELITELKQSLLDDIPATEKAQQDSLNARLFILPSIIIFIVISYGLYFKFGSSDKVEKWQEVSARLPELSQQLMNPEGVALSDAEMANLTLALRTKLHHEPNDAMGWFLLGRIGMSNRDIDTSVGAMKKAYALKPTDVDIKLGYAQALMLSGDDAKADQAKQMLKQVLRGDSTNLRALSLLAFSSFERQDYKGAVSAWKAMQMLIGPDDSRYEMLTRSIERAKSKMNPEANLDKQVPITINLGSNVTLPSQGVVIVSIHPADGSPMPVAAARIPLSRFPLSIMMSDDNNMMEQRKLSDMPNFIVRARIDQDGNVSTKDGDWYGESAVSTLGKNVSLEIDKQY